MVQDLDNINLVQLWPTNLIVSNLNIDTTDLLSEIYQLHSIESAVAKSNYGGWQSNTNLNTNVVFDDLVMKISNVLASTIKPKSIEFKQMWACINKENDFNLIHAHGNQYHLSGVFYVQVPDNSGDIAFRDPRPGAINSSTQLLFGDGDTENFTPINNMLILFPSYLEHYVLPNKSNKDRISISFDLVLG